jgi:hypothetical protein
MGVRGGIDANPLRAKLKRAPTKLDMSLLRMIAPDSAPNSSFEP